MAELLDPSLQPVTAPDTAYAPGLGVVAWVEATNGHVVLEVFERFDRTYGFRYLAWVGWRNRAGEVAGHAWFPIEPEPKEYVDDRDRARALAERHAAEREVCLPDEWTIIPDD